MCSYIGHCLSKKLNTLTRRIVLVDVEHSFKRQLTNSRGIYCLKKDTSWITWWYHTVPLKHSMCRQIHTMSLNETHTSYEDDIHSHFRLLWFNTNCFHEIVKSCARRTFIHQVTIHITFRWTKWSQVEVMNVGLQFLYDQITTNMTCFSTSRACHFTPRVDVHRVCALFSFMAWRGLCLCLM